MTKKVLYKHRNAPVIQAIYFIGNKLLAAKVGLKASRRMVFYNGKIECRLLKYELYKGTR